jgi:hypothetical protein
VSLGAEARTPRLADATAEVDRAMRAALARVREAGVADADIRTLVYAIEPIATSTSPSTTRHAPRPRRGRSPCATPPRGPASSPRRPA